MKIAVVNDKNIIENIIDIPDDSAPENFGGVALPEGLWIGDSIIPLDELRSEKESEISTACNAAIVAGMDVETTQGTEHFSLEETDQINLTTAYNAVLSGAASYPYHADGQLCRMFTAEEITAISNASIRHKLYHTTLCNHLLTWARRAETAEELERITYTADGMPEDLAANMTQILAAAGEVSA